MQQGKCRIGIRGDICVFCFRDYWRRLAVWAGRNHIELIFGNFPTGEPVMFFPAGNRLVRGQAAVLLQAAVIWTVIT